MNYSYSIFKNRTNYFNIQTINSEKNQDINMGKELIYANIFIKPRK